LTYAMQDLVETALGHPVRSYGENAMARCPLHEDRTPSLSVNLTNGLWMCFSCSEKGGLAKLARICGGELDEAEAAIRTAKSLTSPIYYGEEPDFAMQAHEMHSRALREKPLAIAQYFVDRKLHPDVFKHFRLGWDGVKIALPFYDDGKVVGIKYRYPDGSKDSEKGSRRAVYNLDDVRGRPVVILCEGESDTHAVWSELLRTGASDEVVVGGIPGASVAKQQVELWSLDLVWARRVYVLFDDDDAGDKGARPFLEVLGDKGVRARPNLGKDVTDHLLKGGTLGACGLADSDLYPRLAS
jgi:DNA primase